MNWDKLSEVVGSAAPVLGHLLAGKTGAVVGHLIASAFGVKADPKEVVDALSRPDAQQILAALEMENREALLALKNAHDKHLADLQARANDQVNETMRRESQSEGLFYRSWRPLFGYLVTTVFVLQMLMPLYLILALPERLASFMAYTQASMWMWTLAFGVLGVTVYKRSEDKKLKSSRTDHKAALDRITQLTAELHSNVS